MTLRLIQSVSLWLLSITAAVVAADPATHVDSTSRERAAEIKSLGWRQVVESEVPPLRNALGEHWPMIMWHGPGFGAPGTGADSLSAGSRRHPTCAARHRLHRGCHTAQGPESAQVEIPAWEDVRVTLEASTAGATYLVERSSGAVVEVE